MLKRQRFALGGKDEGSAIELVELPALVADRHARVALKAVGADLDGGVVALALKHMADVRKLGEPSLALLQPFVVGADLASLHDWRNVERLQQAALFLHVGFLIGRESIDIPVNLQAQILLSTASSVQVAFCSPHIAAVLHFDKATYRELETDLSTEDVFNLVEALNVDAIREYYIHQDKAAR
jgi:hypothetical protein